MQAITVVNSILMTALFNIPGVSHWIETNHGVSNQLSVSFADPVLQLLGSMTLAVDEAEQEPAISFRNINRLREHIYHLW